LPVLLFAVAAPAVAADPAPRPGEAAPADVAAAQKALRDPATADTMTRIGGALTRAIMNMPIGEIEAAVEGRAPTGADRQRTVGDSVGGPGEADRIERQVAASGAQVQAMGSALANALPGMLAAAGKMKDELEKATANLPDPTYPRR
jgi:hypothetical protein